MKTIELKAQGKKRLIKAISMALPLTIWQPILAETFYVTYELDDGSGLMTGTLSQAILNANTQSGADTIVLNTDVKIMGVMKRLINSDVTLTSDLIQRDIDGDGQFRPLFIKSGQVYISRVNFINGVAKGGDAIKTGAGAGMGGALFIYDGNVSLETVNFVNNRAKGGIVYPPVTNFGLAGGGMYGGNRNSSLRGYRNGGGLFANTGYGGYGNYRDLDPQFGEGGQEYDSTTNNPIRNGGFAGGGAFAIAQFVESGDGGFGGGAGFSNFGNGGDGGFGAGGGNVRHSNYLQGQAGYGGFELQAAGMGGAIFLRSGNLVVENVRVENNQANAVNGAKGLGGGIFVLHTSNNSNGNNQGMPSSLGTVSGCGLSFANNSASGDDNSNNNNDDLFDLANLNTVNQPCEQEIEITGINRLIVDGDGTPNSEDGTDMGMASVNSTINSIEFQIRNIGGQDLNLTGNPTVAIIENTHNAFDLVSIPDPIIGPGQSDSLQLSFSPIQVGAHSATISILNNDSDESAYSFDIQAYATGAELNVFGVGVEINAGDTNPRLNNGTYLGESANQMTFILENQGSLPVIFYGANPIGIIGPEAAHFSVSQQPGQPILNPGESTQFTVAFNPSTTEYTEAEVRINSNDTANGIFRFRIAGGKDIGDFHVTEPEDDGTGLVPNSLSWTILQANEQPGHQLITVDQDVLLTGIPKRLINSDVTIKSAGPVRQVNGNNKYRLLFIKSGQVIIDRLDLYNGKAKGGKPAMTGGGAGLGGAMFVYDGDVKLLRVNIDNSKAKTPDTSIWGSLVGGGGMYFGEATGGRGGAGLFEGSDGDNGGYGGYGNYQDIDPFFGRGGGLDIGNRRHGGFGAGGAGGYFYFGYVTAGNGGFGGGGGVTDAKYYQYTRSVGQGGFGGAPDGFGASYQFGAAMGGAMFIRSGQVELSHVELTNNQAVSNSDSMGLGGGIFILHTLIQLNGNNQGMPAQLATVSACDIDFEGNIAGNDSGSLFNNDDIFDLAQRYVEQAECEVDMTYDLIFKSGF